MSSREVVKEREVVFNRTIEIKDLYLDQGYTIVFKTPIVYRLGMTFETIIYDEEVKHTRRIRFIYPEGCPSYRTYVFSFNKSEIISSYDPEGWSGGVASDIYYSITKDKEEMFDFDLFIRDNIQVLYWEPRASMAVNYLDRSGKVVLRLK